MVEPKSPQGRATDGRFASGNKFARGNPHARHAQSLRTALFAAVTEEDILEIAQALVREAKAGNVHAAREVLDRTLGKPEAWDFLERLEDVEARLVQRKPA